MWRRALLLAICLLFGCPTWVSSSSEVARLYEALSAVVVVSAETPDHQPYMGAGVHIGGGYVLTAKHLTDGHPSVTIDLANGERLTALVIRQAEQIDAALVKLPHVSQSLQALALDKRPLELNEDVYLLSHPAGLVWSLTRAYVMDPDRKGEYQLMATGVGGISGGAVIRTSNYRLTAISVSYMPTTSITLALPIAIVCDQVSCPTP